MKVSELWTDEHKWETWRRVEVAICEVLADEGRIPKEVLPAIRAATISTERVRVLEEETHHEMIAVIRAMAESAGEDGRWIHFGVTSSDVQDTALALQLQESLQVIRDDLVRLADGRVGQRYMPRLVAHNIQRLDLACHEIAVGMASGAVGTHANISSTTEEQICQRLGLDIDPATNQIIARDRYASMVCILAIVATSLSRLAPSSLRVYDLAQRVRMYAMPALENVTLWHERDISHSSVERVMLPMVITCLAYEIRLLLGEDDAQG
jgi:adenylosuccinate lyase